MIGIEMKKLRRIKAPSNIYTKAALKGPGYLEVAGTNEVSDVGL